jgi:hypothetical protein
MIKIPNNGRWIGLTLVGLYFGGVLVYLAWESHVFNGMTPAEHLVNAKTGLHETTTSGVELAISHAAAIPKESAEYQEAQGILEPLHALRDSIARLMMRRSISSSIRLIRRPSAFTPKWKRPVELRRTNSC